MPHSFWWKPFPADLAAADMTFVCSKACSRRPSVPRLFSSLLHFSLLFLLSLFEPNSGIKSAWRVQRRGIFLHGMSEALRAPQLRGGVEWQRRRGRRGLLPLWSGDAFRNKAVSERPPAVKTDQQLNGRVTEFLQSRTEMRQGKKMCRRAHEKDVDKQNLLLGWVQGRLCQLLGLPNLWDGYNKKKTVRVRGT